MTKYILGLLLLATPAFSHELVDRWIGTATETVYRKVTWGKPPVPKIYHYQVEFRVDKLLEGTPVGASWYPKWGCESTLIFIHKLQGVYYFLEEAPVGQRGKPSCLSGELRITPTDDGTLTWEFYGSDDTKPRATATLTRLKSQAKPQPKQENSGEVPSTRQ